MKKLLSVFAVVGLVAGMAQAQELKLGLGVSYRDFDDIDFDGLKNSQFGGLGLVLDGGIWKPFDGDWTTQVNDTTVVENISVPYNGASEDIDGADQWAPVLSAEYLFMTQDEISLSLVANFQYFNVDVGSTMSLANTADRNTYFVVQGIPSPRPTRPTQPFTDLVTTVENDLEMELYVLDVGLKLAYSFDRGIDLFAAAGPTLNLVDMDSEVTESAAVNGAKFHRYSEDDSNRELLFGIYGSLGAQWWMSEKVGLVLEARYDEVFEDAETDYAEVDLSGFSGMAKLMFIF